MLILNIVIFIPNITNYIYFIPLIINKIRRILTQNTAFPTRLIFVFKRTALFSLCLSIHITNLRYPKPTSHSFFFYQHRGKTIYIDTSLYTLSIRMRFIKKLRISPCRINHFFKQSATLRIIKTPIPPKINMLRVRLGICSMIIFHSINSAIRHMNAFQKAEMLFIIILEYIFIYFFRILFHRQRG